MSSHPVRVEGKAPRSVSWRSVFSGCSMDLISGDSPIHVARERKSERKREKERERERTRERERQREREREKKEREKERKSQKPFWLKSETHPLA